MSPWEGKEGGNKPGGNKPAAGTHAAGIIQEEQDAEPRQARRSRFLQLDFNFQELLGPRLLGQVRDNALCPRALRMSRSVLQQKRSHNDVKVRFVPFRNDSVCLITGYPGFKVWTLKMTDVELVQAELEKCKVCLCKFQTVCVRACTRRVRYSWV